MKTALKIIILLAGATATLLLGGCATTEMKGTPFYNGDYSVRRGPAEQRVNAWPICYYRDPALSVFWPIFELTDDHVAVRPLFSVYGLDQTHREYSVLWPLTDFDRQTGDYRVFPYFWGDDYHVLFPLYWRYGNLSGTNGGTDALFPFWFRQQHQQNSLFVSLPWLSGSSSNGANWQLLTPLYYHESDPKHSAIVTPLWAQGHSEAHDWKSLIPLVYWDRPAHTLLSPLWARWKNHDCETYAAPWLLSWEKRQPKRNDLWLASFLSHASWGPDGGSHYVFPIYYRDAREPELLTPFFGWDKSSDGFIYPFTPLAGEWTGDSSGSWVFPIYSHSLDKKTGDRSDTLLLAGGHSTSKYENETWFYPLFSYTDYRTSDTSTESERRYALRGSDFWCFPYCWYANQTSTRRGMSSAPDGKKIDDTNAPPIRTMDFRHGVFPLWSYAHETTPAENLDHTDGSFLLWIYDYKHEIDPASPKNSSATNDYTRARVLWRMWHYERLNGDVSVDVFPTFTFDHKTDGFKKTSLLWHLFRYERSPDGAKKLDVLFVPVLRQKS